MALLQKVTRQPPTMWGPSIVGYGVYRYTYESGRTGEAPVAGFAIRGRELVVYLVAEGDKQKSLLSKLGKHKMGKACLYFKRLADLDRSVLEQLVANSVAQTAALRVVRRQPAGGPHESLRSTVCCLLLPLCSRCLRLRRPPRQPCPRAASRIRSWRLPPPSSPRAA